MSSEPTSEQFAALSHALHPDEQGRAIARGRFIEGLNRLERDPIEYNRIMQLAAQVLEDEGPGTEATTMSSEPASAEDSAPTDRSATADDSRPVGDLTRLVRSAADGDQAAWNEIVDRFSGLLWAICRAFRLNSADTGDVCQLTWLCLLKKLDSIRDPERLPGWLATTCRRECLVLLRRNRRLNPIGDERLLSLDPETPDWDSEREQLEVDFDLEQQVAFVLRRYREAKLETQG
jgi:RNA polymerase sigma factor (sigma-70 family)